MTTSCAATYENVVWNENVISLFNFNPWLSGSHFGGFTASLGLGSGLSCGAEKEHIITATLNYALKHVLNVENFSSNDLRVPNIVSILAILPVCKM